jgi:hypothetical protein
VSIRPRILYLGIDMRVPSGGLTTIYQHAEWLRASGYDCRLVHGRREYRYPFGSGAVPVEFLEEGFESSAEDVVVAPELYPLKQLGRFARGQLVAFIQSHFFMFESCDVEALQATRFDAIIASSEAIRVFAQEFLRPEHLHLVPYAIDANLFSPKPKKLQIAYMPRKLSIQSRFIRNATRLKGLDSVPWVALDQLAHAEVAAQLAESAIFLSCSHSEGFGLPPLEAMAAGCVVVGFHGQGGREYATTQNGLWCEDGDLVQCAKHVETAVRMLQQDPERVRAMTAAGISTAARYDQQQARQALGHAFECILKNRRRS